MDLFHVDQSLFVENGVKNIMYKSGHIYFLPFGHVLQSTGFEV